MYAGDIPSQLIGKRALKGILVGTVGPRRRLSALPLHVATNSRQTRRRLRGLRAPCRSGRKVKGQRFTRGGGFPFYPPGAGVRVRGLLGLSASACVCDTVLCGTSACDTVSSCVGRLPVTPSCVGHLPVTPSCVGRLPVTPSYVGRLPVTQSCVGRGTSACDTVLCGTSACDSLVWDAASQFSVRRGLPRGSV